MNRHLQYLFVGIILTGIFALVVPASAIRPLWASPLSEHATDKIYLNSIRISDDGNYIATYVGGENTLRYFNRSGTLLWNRTFSAESPSWISSISIASDGSVVAVTQLVPGCCHGVVTNTRSNQILLFDRNGSILWNYTTFIPPLAVTISPDDRLLYAGLSDGRIICLNREGSIHWTNTTDAPVHTFAISGDGRIIAAAGTGSSGTSPQDVSYPWDFFVFDQNGIQLSKYRTGGPNSVAISRDGTTIAVVGGKFGNLFLFNRSGKMIRERSFTGTGSSLAMSRDANRILVGTLEGNVYGLDKAGTVLWELPVSGLSRTIVVAGDGSSIAYGNNSTIILSDSDGRVIWQYSTGARVSRLALSTNGRYLGVISDKIYLFDRDTRAPDIETTEPSLASSRAGLTMAGDAYMFQTGPTTIPTHLCEPLEISTTPPPPVTINPVIWHSAGEQFPITGTTTLPANQEILIEVMTADFMSLKSDPRDIFGQTGMVERIKGQNHEDIDRWEYYVNTTGWVPDKYLVRVTPVSANGTPYFTVPFYLLSPEESAAIRILPVTVDPVPHHYDGETFPIGGNTTLMPGQELTVSVVPGSPHLGGGAARQPDTGTTGIRGKTRIEPGNNGINRWAFNLNTTGLEPGTYFIEMVSIDGEHVGRGFFFLDDNPRRVCRILTVPGTPPHTLPQTPAAASLSSGITIGSIICGAVIISGRLKSGRLKR